MTRHTFRQLLMLLLLMTLSPCSENPGGPPPVDPIPANVVATTATDQSAIAGTEVSAKPAVRVANVAGVPLAGVPVQFRVASGGGSASGTERTTDTEGRAVVGGWTVGPSLVSNTLTATVAGLSPVTFTASGVPGPPAKISLTTPPSASAPSRSTFAVQPALQLLDANGNTSPQSGVPVTVSIAAGGGTLAGSRTVTTSSGGAAAFTDLSISGSTGPRTLAFAAGSMTVVTANVLVTPGDAATIAVNGGDNQIAIAATAVVIPPSVRVADADGNPVAGSRVAFAVAGGGGTVSENIAVSTSDGVAAVGGWVLGPVAGVNTLTATSGLAGPSVTFTATGTSGLASAMFLNAGGDQTAVASTAVSIAPSIKIVDANANPVGGISVLFMVTAGGGSVTGANAVSDAAGLAAVGSWVLGSTAGSNGLSATSTGLSGSPVGFTANGVSGTATKLVLTTPPPSVVQNRVAFSTQPVVQSQDANGNAVGIAGRLITASVSGGGTLMGKVTATTGADGKAAFADLSVAGAVGAGALTFSAIGLTSVTASVTTTAGVATMMGVHAGGNNQSAAAGSAVSTAPAVKITDADGNAVSGVSVTFAVTSGGGSVASATSTSDASGVATVESWTLGTIPGPNAMTAAAAGLNGSPLTFNATATVGPAARITMIAGDGQVAVARAAVPVNASVRITDVVGNPVDGYPVTIAAATGAGTVQYDTRTTDASGIATAGWWKLGVLPGVNTMMVSGTGLSGSPVTFSATSVVWNIKELSGGSGLGHACALIDSGAAYCWGVNEKGQLGDGTLIDRSAPVPVVGGHTFKSITVGQHFSCGVTAAGATYCWGYNASGQLGDGTETDRLTPVAVLGGLTFESIEAGYSYACGLTTAGVAYCWGSDDHHELGDGHPGFTQNEPVPIPVAGGLTFQTLSAGSAFTCGLTFDGAAYCWGRNANGQLGINSTDTQASPAPVLGNLIFQSISAGDSHTCALTTGGSAYCWGRNVYGQLGVGSAVVTDQKQPIAVLGELTFEKLSDVARDNQCALTAAGVAYCWGDNSGSQFGNGSGGYVFTPVAAAPELTFKRLVLSYSTMCGISSGGAAYCSGGGLALGNGDGSNVAHPVGVRPP